MKSVLKNVVLGIGLVCSAGSHAWIPAGDIVTIDDVIMWNGSGSDVVFKLSSGYYCYVKPDEKNTLSEILAAWAASKKVSVHCHDAEEDRGGFKAHYLHRIIAYRN
jgi:hypothetical protein